MAERARRRPALGVRARLTLTYASLTVLTGLAMLAAVYVFMRYVPTYAIEASVGATGTAEFQRAPASPLPAPSGSARPFQPTETVPALSLQIASADDVLNTLLLFSALALVLIGALGAWISWVAAGRMLRPLRRIHETAVLAGAGRLDQRVRLRGPDDEFAQLAASFDTMLDRLSGSLHAHQRFAANASHELRTPLATTKAMLDVARADPGGQDVAALTERLLETNQRSIETVDALLDLAEIGQSPLDPGPVDLAGPVREALAEVGPEAAEAKVRIESAAGTALVAGEAVLLRRMATNLLLNAVRHNRPGGRVELSCGPAEAGGAVLTVVNTGPVVPPEKLALLAEPFFRAGGRASAPGGRGHGLGLALVQSIVAAHGGSLRLAGRPEGGLAVTVALPPEPGPGSGGPRPG
ncbi:sensor histidine kinase [Allonocardiopsis opalescens]|uniref:histidine kinase n=1 Tax=Allonocardiopsis opalescens TaxID=1144618 RepID=A0A2T0Q1W9_9ACTN|nr:HAMP domain-containing sensor histidine kinase [Allonocardiopsis opalescens]PRX97795.1 two-component system sensor histidine kinase VanS [Allonocardiopsis opalescens]